MKTREWRALIRKLRKHFPISLPVTIRRYGAEKHCGITRYSGSRFRVRINSNLSDISQVDTLLHEWAHVLTLDRAFQHDENWGVAHAEIYDTWAKDFPEDAT